LGLLYFGSLVMLIMYSVLYGFTAKESRWLGAITSAAVIVLGKVFSCVKLFLFLDSLFYLFRLFCFFFVRLEYGIVFV
jgi:hypothetical protein